MTGLARAGVRSREDGHDHGPPAAAHAPGRDGPRGVSVGHVELLALRTEDAAELGRLVPEPPLVEEPDADLCFRVVFRELDGDRGDAPGDPEGQVEALPCAGGHDDLLDGPEPAGQDASGWARVPMPVADVSRVRNLRLEDLTCISPSDGPSDNRG